MRIVDCVCRWIVKRGSARARSIGSIAVSIEETALRLDLAQAQYDAYVAGIQKQTDASADTTQNLVRLLEEIRDILGKGPPRGGRGDSAIELR